MKTLNHKGCVHQFWVCLLASLGLNVILLHLECVRNGCMSAGFFPKTLWFPGFLPRSVGAFSIRRFACCRKILCRVRRLEDKKRAPRGTL